MTLCSFEAKQEERKPKPKRNVSVDSKKGEAKMKLKPKKCSKEKVMRRTSIGSKCVKKSA